MGRGESDVGVNVVYRYPSFSLTGPGADPIALDEAYEGGNHDDRWSFGSGRSATGGSGECASQIAPGRYTERYLQFVPVSQSGDFS
jgi:hypothetical protein